MLDSGAPRFRLDDSGTLWVSSSVTIIQEEWEENDSIRSLKFEQSSRLSEIGRKAFFRCRNLASVSVPASVDEICDVAFSDCSGLREVIFSAESRLRKIANAFHGCTSLSRIRIPPSVEQIEHWAFRECSGLTEVLFSIDGCLRKIDGFQKCTSLNRVEIPASVEDIDLSAFSECSGLTEVIFSTNSRLKRLWGFGGCASLSRVEIPASVEDIDFLGLKISPAWGLLEDLSRRELIFESGTHLRSNANQEYFRGFIFFKDENDLKRRRRQVHL
jgi:hypothetical protein